MQTYYLILYLYGSAQIDFCYPTKTKYIVIKPPSLKGDLSQKHILIENTLLHRIGKDCDEKLAFPKYGING